MSEHLAAHWRVARTAAWVGLALLVCGGHGLGQEPNPVTNGGFESVTPAGLPVDWQIMGTGALVDDAHSGRRAVRLERAADEAAPEVGMNRAWEADSGRQDAMLDRRSGGIVFWYKLESAAPKARVSVYAIPMGAKPLEDTGEQRAEFAIPHEHAGDGEWHEGRLAYDFSKNEAVKWVHISPRLVGGAAVLLLDDLDWVEKVGPVLQVRRFELVEDAMRPGTAGDLELTVRNVGDEPTGKLSLEADLPKDLAVSRGSASVEHDALPPGGDASVAWRVTGRREGRSRIRVSGGTAASSIEAALVCEPVLRLEQLQTQRFILWKGASTTVSCWLTNEGRAIARDVSGELAVPEGFALRGSATRRLASVAPGQRAALSWTVSASDETPGAYARAAVRVGDEPVGELGTLLVSGGRCVGQPPAAVGAGTNDVMAIVGNDRIRLAFAKASFGYGPAELFVRGTGTFAYVGAMPRLGRLVVQGDDGPADVFLTADQVRAEENRLVFTRTGLPVGGGTWDFTWTVTVPPDSNVAEFAASAKSSDAAKVLAFEGPMLYAGEGAFGEQKGEALFPGLEWLEGMERSSNTLDIELGHPDQVRYVPHPNKVTIPLMSVYWNGVTVGLLWDHRQRWDGVHDRPSAVFASPDYFEGKQAHLMGLFAPSGTEWVKENQRLAETPYELPAGGELTLTAGVFARAPVTDALVAMDEWIQRYGVPEPNPIPRGSYAAEMDFSMQAYLKSLWIEEESVWWSSRGAGPVLSPKGHSPNHLYDLLLGAGLTENAELATQCRALADRVRELAGIRAIAQDDGLRFGEGAEAQITSGHSSAASLIAGMGPDGGWRFDADQEGTGPFAGMDYHELGADNALELGMCANHAATLIRHALLTADPAIYQAALKPLALMQQFRVPRAAQVWEVPVHTPDILAASDAVDAYVAAYEYSGDKVWLADARRWARAGLPFVYLWSDDSKPFLRYGSIPVFGASWNKWSWFGRPVQWNGLRYARAVYRLAEYDDSLPWRQIAEGITRSAQYQQSADEDDIALWPDSISAIDSSKAAWLFSPNLILWNALPFMGLQPDPQTQVLRTKTGRIHVTATAEVSAPELEGQALRFRVRYPKGDQGLVVVAGVTEPSDVVVNERDLQRVPEPQALFGLDEPAWCYIASDARAMIWFPTSGRQVVRLDGVVPKTVQVLPTTLTAIDFGFDQGTDAWVAANGLEPLQVRDGLLVLKATNPDPYMVRSALRLDGSTVTAITVRMKVSAGAQGQLYWLTETSPGFSEDRVVKFDLTPGEEFAEYRIVVGGHRLWDGQTITGIRLDFTGGAPDATAEIDYIRGTAVGAAATPVAEPVDVTIPGDESGI